MGSIRRYMKFVQPYKWQIVGTVLIGIIKFAIPLLIPLLLKYVLDDDKNAQAIYISYSIYCILLQLRIDLLEIIP